MEVLLVVGLREGIKPLEENNQSEIHSSCCFYVLLRSFESENTIRCQ
jgi:hypothetical protein